jgi:NAD(P)-dependent dehydrogenase (short-subunit alcohol dehydrogenase family)
MTHTDMQGKICLVTGSTRGLGKATALALAQPLS